MIKYNLICKNKHEFESWFSDSEEFEKLLQKKLLECIFCNSKEVKKTIMSPKVLNSKNIFEAENINNKELAKVKNDLSKLRKFVEKNFEYVGNNLAKKVREAYYDRKNKKNIYGTTTSKERDELLEEGIEITSIPWVEKDN
jgi:hypothetical protein|tara:strand:+ start:3678 stop:4100 length:423 start_codon:yes stop_codon:yes gene_type:complete